VCERSSISWRRIWSRTDLSGAALTTLLANPEKSCRHSSNYHRLDNARYPTCTRNDGKVQTQGIDHQFYKLDIPKRGEQAGLDMKEHPVCCRPPRNPSSLSVSRIKEIRACPVGRNRPGSTRKRPEPHGVSALMGHYPSCAFCDAHFVAAARPCIVSPPTRPFAKGVALARWKGAALRVLAPPARSGAPQKKLLKQLQHPFPLASPARR
jgi:hypothetical protein